MRAQEARDLGRQIADLVQAGDQEQAHVLLVPVLAERTPFASLGRIGEAVGAGPLPSVNRFLKLIAAEGTVGGWVVIASALGAQLERDLEGALSRCKSFATQADEWYGADILGERVPGPALVESFQPTLNLLSPWREDANRWVRRMAGVAVHFWAKRSQGADRMKGRAETLLGFLDPMFGEWEIDAVKGVGWGLKTLGRHYPDLVADWIAEQVIRRKRRHRALMLRKALKYLSPEHRARATGATP